MSFANNGESIADPAIDHAATTINAPLFQTTQSAGELTEIGQHLLDMAHRILGDDDARGKAFDGGGDGPVRIGISSMLLDFLVDHPDHALLANASVTSDICSKIVTAFDDGEVDVAMVIDVRDHRQRFGRYRICDLDIEFAWMKASSFVLEPDAPIPLATWPADQHIVLNALSESQRPYKVMFTGPDYASKFTAVRSGQCVAVAPRNAIVPPLVAADDPQLPGIAPRKILLAVRGDPTSERFKSIVSVLSSFQLN